MNNSHQAKTYKVSGNYDGKSAEARRRERRRQLIDTGIQLFGQQGYATVSLNAICAEAGLTKRYFYESFDSVEDLLIAAFREISQDIQHEVIQKIAAQDTPKAMIAAGFRCFYEYIQAHPQRGRVFLVEALSVHPSRGELIGNGGGDVSQFLLTSTRQFLGDRKLAESVLMIMAQGAVGAAIFVGQNWIATDYQQPVDQLVQGVSEICFGIAQRLEISLEATA